MRCAALILLLAAPAYAQDGASPEDAPAEAVEAVEMDEAEASEAESSAATEAEDAAEEAAAEAPADEAQSTEAPASENASPESRAADVQAEDMAPEEDDSPSYEVVAGPCVLDLAWTAAAPPGEPSYASIGSCEAQGAEPLLRLTCEGGAIQATFSRPYNAEPGTPATGILMVDGRRADLSGTAARYETGGFVRLEDAPISRRDVERLASGRNGLMITANAYAPFHLTGSRRAIMAMLDSCGASR